MNTKAHVWITFLVAMIATLGQTTAIIKEGHTDQIKRMASMCYHGLNCDLGRTVSDK
jgi:hypothetical protein